MKAIAVLLIVVMVLATPVAWLASSFALYRPKAGGELVVMTQDQAKECEEGGGCNVLSARQMAMIFMLMALQMKKGRGDGGI